MQGSVKNSQCKSKSVKFSEMLKYNLILFYFLLFKTEILYYLLLFPTPPEVRILLAVTLLLGRKVRGRNLIKPGKGYNQRRAVPGESLLWLTAVVAFLGLSMDP